VHEDLQIANMTGRPEPRPDDSGGCGHRAHADVNAARNSLRAGLALQGTRNVT